MSQLTPAQRLTAAIRSPKHPGRPAVMPYVTSGFPTRDGFGELLLGIGELADAIEVGVPFSDPMADGPVIQRSSRVALDGGVTLEWILQTIEALPRPPAAPLVLMSYLNPLLAYGLERVVEDAARIGFSGFIVPDLPWEESAELRGWTAARGLALIQLVTPVTPLERLRLLTAGEDGFVYAVTITGITGAEMRPAEVAAYLDRVRSVSHKPVCAGFGIRTAAHVRALTGHADGAIVGSAFVQALEQGVDPVAFVKELVQG
jgi:tryptophan synthase alpha chain